MTSSRTPAWITVLLGIGVVSTLLSVPAAGYVWLELQFFGETANRDDYLTASAVALVGAGWMLLAALTSWVARTAAWLQVTSWLGLVLMTGLFVYWDTYPADSAVIPDPTSSLVVGGLVGASMPWCWAILAAFAGALAHSGDHAVAVDGRRAR